MLNLPFETSLFITVVNLEDAIFVYRPFFRAFDRVKLGTPYAIRVRKSILSKCGNLRWKRLWTLTLYVLKKFHRVPFFYSAPINKLTIHHHKNRPINVRRKINSTNRPQIDPNIKRRNAQEQENSSILLKMLVYSICVARELLYLLRLTCVS